MKIWSRIWKTALCFEAADIDYAASFTDAERKLYALPADHIYAVYKH